MRKDELIAQIFKISRASRKHTASVGPDEPSMLQLQAMHYIDETTPTISQLANEFCIKVPTATVLIDRLDKAKFTKRSQNTQDHRISNIHLTTKGKKVLNEILAKKMARIEFILDKLSLADKSKLFQILVSLNKKLEEN